jgi:hypothetical protein
MSNLIVDRTDEDVEYARELRQLIMRREAAPEQWEEWLEELRGRYSFHTLNRVAFEMIETARIVSERYKSVSVFPKTDWTEREYPTHQQLRAYLDEIDKIRKIAAEVFDVPELPENMNNLTHQAANNIEKILFMAREMVESAGKVFVQSGMVQCGFTGPYMITGG